MPCCLAASSQARLLRVSDSCPTLMCQESGAPNSPPCSLVPMRSVLVTGASTGIGRATALRLDASGWRVFAGVRKEADAESLRAGGLAEPRPRHPRRHRRRADRRRGRADRARERRRGLDGLVNNAGVAVPGPLETIPLEDLRHQLEVNLVAYVAVTQAMLPQIRRAEGRIVFLASIGGRDRLPLRRALPRLEVRDRGDRRRLPPGAAALGDRGRDHRARLDRHPDLGARPAAKPRRSKRSRRRRTCSTAPRSTSSAR